MNVLSQVETKVTRHARCKSTIQLQDLLTFHSLELDVDVYVRGWITVVVGKTELRKHTNKMLVQSLHHVRKLKLPIKNVALSLHRYNNYTCNAAAVADIIETTLEDLDVIDSSSIEHHHYHDDHEHQHYVDTTNIMPIHDLRYCTNEQVSNAMHEYDAVTTSDELCKRAMNLLYQCQGKQFLLGFEIDLFDHNLQAATLAYKDNCNDDLIITALFHDIGELLSPCNHGDISAAILKPYINDKCHWILKNHEIFQAYYYKTEEYRHIRDVYSKHEYYDDCALFCEKYDAPAFNKSLPIMDINDFKPLIKSVFERPMFCNDLTNPKRNLFF